MFHRHPRDFFRPPSVVSRAVAGDAGWTGPTSGLVSAWPMNDAHVLGGTVKDTINGFDATIHGTITSDVGPSTNAGYARKFDGSTGYLSLAANPGITWTGSWSIGGWVKFNTKTGSFGSGGFGPRILNWFDGTNNVVIHVSSTTQINFTMNTTPQITTNSTYAGKWFHFVITFNGTTLVPYLNGITGAGTGGVAATTTTSNVIGAADTSNHGLCEISMAELVLYNRVLTATEVATLYYADIDITTGAHVIGDGLWSGPTSGLVAAWPLNKNKVVGSVAKDVIGSNDATINGTVVWSQGPTGDPSYGARFDGSAVYFSFASTPGGISWDSHAWSIGAWVKMDSVGTVGSAGFGARFLNWDQSGAGTNAIVLWDDNAGPHFTATLNTAGTRTSLQETLAIQDITWQHFVVTFDGASTKTLYVNGILAGTQAPVSGDASTTATNVIGARDASLNGLWPGFMADLVLYNRVLSGAEVTTLYNADLGFPVAGDAAWTGPTSGLVHAWPMSYVYITGTTVKDTIGSVNGTITGSLIPGWGPISISYSAWFGGGTGYVVLGSSPYDWSGAFTLAMWLFTSDVTNISACFLDDRVGNGTNYVVVNTDTTGKVQASRSGTGVVTSSVVLANNQWHHIAYTSSQLLYIDGQAVSTAAFNGDKSDDVVSHRIGANSSGGAVVHGGMAETVIYNRVLSAAEVTQLYGAR